MTAKIVVGLDGSATGERAAEYAKKLGGRIGDFELVLVFVVEWSPFSFQTPEENEKRHARRQEEIKQATDRVLKPAVEKLKAEGVNARGVVHHGDVADTLDRVAVEEKADQIVIGRTSDTGLASRIFGSSTANLVMHAHVPVTVVS